MKTSALERFFPLSDLPGADCSQINTRRMRSLAMSGDPINRTQLMDTLAMHHLFLENGGAGGRWKSLLVKDIVIGIYEGPESDEGEQANFERLNLTKVDLSALILPFANFCACFAPQVTFAGADLTSSLFTDAALEKTDFRNCKLSRSDFSRADLRQADFRNATLIGVDFENCDLSAADFRGARMEHTRFPGAILDGVKY